MSAPGAELVDVVRDYLLADRLLRHLFERLESGELRFDEVQELVGDDERSVLFRLKEHCHSLFRSGRGRIDDGRAPRAALFDLAVGSLFHEAMKLRENLYQAMVYGPKVRALRKQAGAEADDLFREFERILALAEARLAEARSETRALLAQTRSQLRGLLAATSDRGVVTRFLIDQHELVGEVFPDGIDGLLAEIHGSAGAGYVAAARSWLESGWFREALGAIESACAHGAEPERMERLRAYASAMEQCVQGRYGAAIDGLAAWLELGPPAIEEPFLGHARAAVQRIAEARSSAPEGAAAAQLGRRLATLAQA